MVKIIAIILLAMITMSLAWYFCYLMLASFLRDMGEDAEKAINNSIQKLNNN